MDLPERLNLRMCRKAGSQPRRAKEPIWRFSGEENREYLVDG